VPRLPRDRGRPALVGLCWPVEGPLGSPTSPKAESRERLGQLARLRWQVELDYRKLKGELGLDHHEGRNYSGFRHHTAPVTSTFLALERLDPKARRPA